jgi:hypothetical protein
VCGKCGGDAIYRKNEVLFAIEQKLFSKGYKISCVEFCLANEYYDVSEAKKVICGEREISIKFSEPYMLPHTSDGFLVEWQVSVLSNGSINTVTAIVIRYENKKVPNLEQLKREMKAYVSLLEWVEKLPPAKTMAVTVFKS